MTAKVLYAELTPEEFRQRIAAAPIAYLPLGTLEWHGEHLPLGSDGLQSQGFFQSLASAVGGIVLPMLFVGPDRRIERDGRELYGMDYFPDESRRRYPDQQLAGSAYWVDDELFAKLLHGIMTQLARAGFRMVVGHGHGPSTKAFAARADEWKERYCLATFMCWGSPQDGEGLGIQVDHAGMNETSLVMALRPDLVRMERLGTDPSKPLVGIGGKDPRTHASPELGHKIIAMNLTRMAGVLRDALAKLGK